MTCCVRGYLKSRKPGRVNEALLQRCFLVVWRRYKAGRFEVKLFEVKLCIFHKFCPTGLLKPKPALDQMQGARTCCDFHDHTRQGFGRSWWDSATPLNPNPTADHILLAHNKRGCFGFGVWLPVECILLVLHTLPPLASKNPGISASGRGAEVSACGQLQKDMCRRMSRGFLWARLTLALKNLNQAGPVATRFLRKTWRRVISGIPVGVAFPGSCLLSRISKKTQHSTTAQIARLQCLLKPPRRPQQFF